MLANSAIREQARSYTYNTEHRYASKLVERSVIEKAETYATALELSIRHQHHLFDTLYHAVALHVTGASLVTADRRYYEKAGAEGCIIHLADWAPA